MKILKKYSNRFLAVLTACAVAVVILVGHVVVDSSSDVYCYHFDIGIALAIVGVFILWKSGICRRK